MSDREYYDAERFIRQQLEHDAVWWPHELLQKGKDGGYSESSLRAALWGLIANGFAILTNRRQYRQRSESDGPFIDYC